jgi:hypothetical protein
VRRAAWGIADLKIIAHALGASIAASLALASVNLLPASALYLGDARKDKYENARSFVAGTQITSKNCSWYNGAGPDLKVAIDNCTVGALRDDKKIFYVLGDSHAGNLSGWISLVSHSNQYAARILYVHGQPTPPVPLVDYIDYMNKDRTELKKRYDFQQLLMAMTLSAVKSGDVIIISNYLAGFFGQGADVASGREREKALLVWVEKLKQLTKKAEKKGFNIVLVGPLPRFASSENSLQNITFQNCSVQWFRPKVPKYCFLWANRSLGLLETRSVMDSIRGVVAQSKNLYLFDPFPLFCDGSHLKCSNYKGSSRVYLDTNHLNVRGSMVLAPEFMKFLVTKRLI